MYILQVYIIFLQKKWRISSWKQFIQFMLKCTLDRYLTLSDKSSVMYLHMMMTTSLLLFSLVSLPWFENWCIIIFNLTMYSLTLISHHGIRSRKEEEEEGYVHIWWRLRDSRRKRKNERKNKMMMYVSTWECTWHLYLQ